MGNGNNVLSCISDQIRRFVAGRLAIAETSFVEIATFAAEVNEAAAMEMFYGGEDVGEVWYTLDRSDDEWDRYTIDPRGSLKRIREAGGASSRAGEFVCTADEWAGAMASYIELALRRVEYNSENSRNIACRIVKPVIEFCTWTDTGRTVARLASTGFERSGENLWHAINNLLMALGEKGLPGKSASYTLVLVPTFDGYRKTRRRS